MAALVCHISDGCHTYKIFVTR